MMECRTLLSSSPPPPIPHTPLSYMISSLSNFFPASLQSSSSPRGFPPPGNPESYGIDEDDDTKSVISESGIVIGLDGKKKKGKGAHETFIIVRPPPSKSNHPLNLQVQLVPPHGSRSQTIASVTGDSASGTSSRRASVDSSISITGGASLSRTTSFSSSFGPSDSTASISSTSTSASNLSSRRTIVPLYSLQAHNVLTNIVADAGTDAKIAKFQKRGLEMIDLGILDCVEVWPCKDKDKAKDVNIPKPSFRPANSGGTEFTPGSSAVSLSSAGHSHLSHSMIPETLPEISISPSSQPITPLTPRIPEESQPPPSPTKKNIFGKFFSRKDRDINKTPTPSPHSLNTEFTPPFPATPSKSNGSAPSPSTRLEHLRSGSGPNKEEVGGSVWKRHSRNLSFGLGQPSAALSSPRSTTSNSRPTSFVESGLSEFGAMLGGDNSLKKSVSPHSSLRSSIDATHLPVLSAGPPSAAATPNLEVLRPAVLGLQPSSTGTISPKLRAQLYVWTMRRWIKGNDNSLFGSLLSGVGSGFKDGVGGNMTPKPEDEEGKGNKGKVELRFEWRKSLKGKKKKTDKGTGGKDGKGPGTAGSLKADDEDAGDLSDAEDSETPWVCTLKIKRAVGPSVAPTNGLSPTTSATNGKPQRRMSAISDFGSEEAPKEKESKMIRVKVATLSPTPHHPKIVGMLKVPFPLADFDFSPSLPGGVVMRKRVTGQTPEPLVGGDGLPKGFTLTAEEIKDVASVSGLWLVVRESFGGVGREKRKGDGWKLRG